MRQIKLTQGQFALVDDEDYGYLNQWKWRAKYNQSTNSYYAMRRDSQNKNIFMHSLLMSPPDGMEVDHVWHNTLDNQKSNLRIVTRSQNLMNTKPRKDNLLGIKGIYFRKDRGTYIARLYINGEYVLRKTCYSLEEAIFERQKAEEQFFGQFMYRESQS